MRAVTPAAEAALASEVVALVQLVHMDFGPGQVVALNSSNWDLQWDGVTYRGAAGLGTIAAITDAPGEVKGLQFEMAGVAASSIALALDDADQWQGAPITLRTAVLDASYQVVDAPVEWTGYGDTMSLVEDGQTARITATAESSAVNLLRGNARTYSDTEHQAAHPGDRFFEYMADQSDKPVVWPSKAWFYK